MIGRWQSSRTSIEIHQGDITAQQVDAVVNAANSRLAGGGGVDGAIHRAAGPSVMAETRDKYPDGCPTGSAVISGAGKLHAKHLLHAVGPVWGGGKNREPELLAGAYRTCLQLAADHQCESIAFPAISCGVYGYPIDQAAQIAFEVTARWSAEHDQPGLIRFVLFSADVFEQFARAGQEVLGPMTKTE